MDIKSILGINKLLKIVRPAKKREISKSSSVKKKDSVQISSEAKRSDEVKKYNRMSLIIQGLYDRSPVFHPHPPVQLWDIRSFNQNIELIYDADYVLNSADFPDFKAYWDECNESIGVGSIVIGQQRVWEGKEADKENARRDRSWRGGDYHKHYTRYKPEGNPGPGFIARVDKCTRTGKCTFTWVRKCVNWRSYKHGEAMSCKFTVHKDDLFNVSAYALGDFRQFFNDYRWRMRYLEWGPFLLGAEDYHAGKLKVESCRMF